MAANASMFHVTCHGGKMFHMWLGVGLPRAPDPVIHPFIAAPPAAAG
jgi:hypothetical protein